MTSDTPADGEALAEDIAELQMMDLDDGDCWTEDEVRRTQSPNDLRVIATILNAVLSGQLITLETCNARVDAMISRAREVKPLVWKEYAEQGFWRADTPIGEYSVGFDDGWWAQLEGVEFWEWETPEDPRCYSGPEAGMLACKADYTARALATLRANATDASEGER